MFLTYLACLILALAIICLFVDGTQTSFWTLMFALMALLV